MRSERRPRWGFRHYHARSLRAQLKVECHPVISRCSAGPHFLSREVRVPCTPQSRLTTTAMFKRLGNLIRGFFGLAVTNLEKQNPEALLEVEKENLRTQIA